MSGNQQNGAFAGAVLLLVALALAGCSTSIAEIPIGSAAPEARTKEPGAFLPVNALPPARAEAAMDPAEQAKVQKELVAARDHQASTAAAKGQGQANDQSQAQSTK